MGFGDLINSALGSSSPTVGGVQYQNTGTDYGEKAQKAQTQIGQGSSGLDTAQGLYTQAAQGNAPSVAQLQLQSGQQDAARQAAQLAAGARGTGNQLYAANMAQQQNAIGQQNTNAQSAMLRANEMAQARAGLAGVAAQQSQLGQNYQLQNNAQSIAEREAALRAAQGTQTAQTGADVATMQSNNQTALANVGKLVGGIAAIALWHSPISKRGPMQKGLSSLMRRLRLRPLRRICAATTAAQRRNSRALSEVERPRSLRRSRSRICAQRTRSRLASLPLRSPSRGITRRLPPRGPLRAPNRLRGCAKRLALRPCRPCRFPRW